MEAKRYETSHERQYRKAREHAHKAPKFVFDPVLFDRMVGLEAGSIVVKTQPYGAPRNGTMGQCYIADAETGKFIGMVCLNSLTKLKKGK